MSSLDERIAKEFPDRDVRVLSVEPLKVRYRNGDCSATKMEKVEATFENAKRLILECIRGVDDGN